MDDTGELFTVRFNRRTGQVREWRTPVGMTELDAETMTRVTEELPRVVGDPPTERIQIEQGTARMMPRWRR